MLQNTKAVIFPGSHISVYDNYEYLSRTKKFIYNLSKNHPNIKILGICFGAQIVAESLGGKVSQMKRDYFSGVESIRISENFWSLEFVKRFGVLANDDLEIMKLHGDEIRNLPNDFQQYGTSPSCKNEILISDTNNVLLIQGHPEYETKFVFVRSLAKKIKKNKELNDKYIRNYMKEIPTYDAMNFRKICYAFLNY